MAKLRDISSGLTESLGTDYEATIAPIKSVKQDFDGIKSDLTKAVTSLGTEASPTTPESKGPAEAKDDDDGEVGPDDVAESDDDPVGPS